MDEDGSQVLAYDRPMYTYTGGIDGFSRENINVIAYTGSRWFSMQISRSSGEDDVDFEDNPYSFAINLLMLSHLRKIKMISRLVAGRSSMLSGIKVNFFNSLTALMCQSIELIFVLLYHSSL